MPGDEAVAEEDDRCEDSEELPGGGDDGAGQGAKVTHAQEDEKLKWSNNFICWNCSWFSQPLMSCIYAKLY